MFIGTHELKNLTEDHIHGSLRGSGYVCKEIDALSLLVPSRLDICFKLLYLRLRHSNQTLAIDIYKQHIRAFTLGQYSEPGSATKSDFGKFLDEFATIEKRIRARGFLSSVSVIPHSGGVILNGSHRVAVCIVVDTPLSVVDVNGPRPVYDYQFFKDRGVSEFYLSLALLELTYWKRELHFAVFWPTSELHHKQLLCNLPEPYFKMSVKANFRFLMSIVRECYKNENWVGRAGLFEGLNNKTLACLGGGSKLVLLLFDRPKCGNVVELKNELRDVVGLGKHAMHMTDTIEEVRSLIKLLHSSSTLVRMRYGNWSAAKFRKTDFGCSCNKDVLFQLENDYHSFLTSQSKCGLSDQLKNLDFSNFLFIGNSAFSVGSGSKGQHGFFWMGVCFRLWSRVYAGFWFRFLKCSHFVRKIIRFLGLLDIVKKFIKWRTP